MFNTNDTQKDRGREKSHSDMFGFKSVLFNYIDFIHDCKHSILTNNMRHNIYSARHDKIAQHMNLKLYKNMFKVHYNFDIDMLNVDVVL